MDDAVKQLYEKPDGEFEIVEINRSDKLIIDKMVRVLIKLDVHKWWHDKDKLLSVWKRLNKGAVRKFRG